MEEGSKQAEVLLGPEPPQPAFWNLQPRIGDVELIGRSSSFLEKKISGF